MAVENSELWAGDVKFLNNSYLTTELRLKIKEMAVMSFGAVNVASSFFIPIIWHLASTTIAY